jgi:type I restriction-modification system DNA methylase subunit
MTIDPRREIIRQLEKVYSNGNRSSEIFYDFLEMTHAALEGLPGQLKAITEKVQFVDHPDTAQLFKRMHEKYKPYYFEFFQNAFAALIASTDEFQDVLGDVYMEFGVPSKGAGQFFTPYNICELMAKLTCGDMERQVHDRIKDACKGNPMAEAMLMASYLIQDEDQADFWFFERILPSVAPHVDPIKVCDCCCGSGAMLLAAAAQCPPWALHFGLVQFYGQDIDQTCVLMAKTNMMLYGLNGFGIKCVLGLTQAEMQSIPEPWKEKFEEAQAADKAGDVEKVKEIQKELGVWKQSSLL